VAFVCIERRRRASLWGCALLLAAALFAPPADAENNSPELIQPSVCSRATASDPALKGICEVKLLAGGHNEVKINLTAGATPIMVGGYTVVTENYNGNYLTPVVEALPGDTVSAHLDNLLPPRPQSQCQNGTAHEEMCDNATNLHYFHGGIVTPNNARPLDARKGTGDNIYVYLKNGFEESGKPHSFDFTVPIPGEGELDGRVLEAKENDGKIPTIAHPTGLNWYHSHLHGISSDQVMGGMSGLLSVGEGTANVMAACKPAPYDNTKCAKETADLKNRTEVRYALLRDIPLRLVKDQFGQVVLPNEAKGQKAFWTPDRRDFPPGEECAVWTRQGSQLVKDPYEPHEGFCQRDQDSVWLFTLNGQRFPTITVEGGHNLLLRLGNVSANVAYWLELCQNCDKPNKKILPLTLVSLDGVVPARPVAPDQATIPVEASHYDDLLLMPASRAEIYVRNDDEKHPETRVYILHTKGLNAGTDQWPEVRLARIVLKPIVEEVSTTLVALNAPVERISPRGPRVTRAEFAAAKLPPGCVRDLQIGEHRRVIFFDGGETSDGRMTDWSIATQILQPPEGQPPTTGWLEDQFLPAQPVAETTVGRINNDELIGGVPFEEYEQEDGSIDWDGKRKKHVCIRLDPGGTSHKQLWILVNTTSAVHNFHIHQMKFRLATPRDFKDYHLVPLGPSHTCTGECTEPDYKLYEEKDPSEDDPKSAPLWHDTIPVPPGRVYLIMSFDAQQQVGRFVFHCHILKHEDKGLMAPIEVWAPAGGPATE
jgi:FtsP/CotA-like multicopper oxidase with cupredoxin domain